MILLGVVSEDPAFSQARGGMRDSLLASVGKGKLRFTVDETESHFWVFRFFGFAP